MHNNSKGWRFKTKTKKTGEIQAVMKTGAEGGTHAIASNILYIRGRGRNRKGRENQSRSSTNPKQTL